MQVLKPCPSHDGQGFLLQNSMASTFVPAVDMSQVFDQAVLQHRGGNIMAAEAGYRKIILNDPNHSDAWHLLGVIAYQTSQYEKSIELISQAIRLRPDVASYFNNLGNAHLSLGCFEESTSCFQRAIELQPEYAEAFNNLGNALKRKGTVQEAEAAYIKAVTLNKGYADAFYNLGNLYASIGRFEDAVQCLTKSLVLKPGNPDAHNNLGDVYRRTKQVDLAERHFKEALGHFPDSVEALNNLGNLYHSRANFELALKYYLKAIYVAPANIVVCVNVVNLLRDLGRIAEASQVINDFLPYLRAALAHQLHHRSTEEARCSLELLANILIIQWLEGTFSEQSVETIGGLLRGISRTPKSSNALVYCTFVSALINRFEDVRVHLEEAVFRDAKALYVVGESHSLALCNRCIRLREVNYRAHPIFLMGVKMWHIASSTFRQVALSQRIQSIPGNSSILFTIGEIDCRPTEGIWKVHQASHQAIDVLIDRTVQGYVDFLEDQLAKKVGMTVILQGIPRPQYSLNSLAESERAEFLGMVRTVNARLREHAARWGWLFLDVHKATDSDDIFDGDRWHLDDYHLKPEFYNEASQWLIG
ncbi:tetratricopeptide repeat protein [Noviherbaspirillum sp. ST9]|uniref:tetratricopeptide repeat protein n=1 Tax=Noviherbaspirillum sp. ST9 TaxID=3401606 RepID=UPI003B5873EE